MGAGAQEHEVQFVRAAGTTSCAETVPSKNASFANISAISVKLDLSEDAPEPLMGAPHDHPVADARTAHQHTEVPMASSSPLPRGAIDDADTIVEAPAIALRVDGDVPIGLSVQEARVLEELLRKRMGTTLAAGASRPPPVARSTPSAPPAIEPSVSEASASTSAAPAAVSMSVPKRWQAAKAQVLNVDGDEAVGMTPWEAQVLRELRRAHGLEHGKAEQVEEERDLRI